MRPEKYLRITTRKAAMNNQCSVRKKHHMKWSRNAVAKRERLRIERAGAPLPPEAAHVPLHLAPAKYATVSVRCGRESLTFRVTRISAKRFLVRNQFRAASWIGKVIAVALDGILA